MDDLYDNLENYNDVNVVEELKTENKELKSRLDEYSKTMVQLQKDFDKLNSEYKKLELNYSSLLKTARAEIQRKTEMINDLNLQKDKIIINTMKKSGKNFYKATRSPYLKEQAKKNEKNNEPIVSTQKQNKGDLVDKSNQKDTRVDPLHTPVGSTSSVSTESKSVCSEEQAPRSIDCCDKNKNKENYSKFIINEYSRQSDKIDIRNRRKSLPGNSCNEAKFSSDEDTEPKVTDNTQPFDTRYEDMRDYRRDSNERYDSQREPRSRLGKYTNHETYSNVDKYNNFQKHRRHYSPDRNQSRYSKENGEYTEYYPSRDYRKQTATKSPPPHKYERSKSRDRRYNYDRDRLDYYRDYEKPLSRYYEHSASKHKSRNEFDDEPSCKRQKIDTYGKYKTDTNSNNNEKEREVAERKNIAKPYEHTLTNSSCQSPDYVNVDSNLPQHFVKEIMTTTATNLEDPRISSKKYILNLCNDTPVLSTVVGRNVDVKCVNKSDWGIENIDVPVPLTKPTLEQNNDDILKDIYMDIENPDLNESLESGEIVNYDDDMATFYSRDNDKDYNNEKNNKRKPSDLESRNAKERDDDKNELKKLTTKTFKIPKITKPDKLIKERDLEYQDIRHISQKNRSDEKCNKVNENVENISNKPKHYNEHDKIENSEANEDLIEKRAQEIIRTIEGDLELSDEASDTDSHKNIGIHETNTDLSVNKTTANSFKLKESYSDESDKTTNRRSHTVKSSTKKDKTTDSSKENKKSKSKKKSLEKSETNNKKHQNENEINKSHERKKQKDKECKETISKQTKNKFSDLFGDSSSLITPDDLGINNVQEQPVDKYTPIFENTQDAVDLCVEDIAKTSTSKSKLNTFETVLNKLSVEKPDETITKNFNVNVTIVNDISENILDNKNECLSNVYENAKSETANESNIVKTMIISSGIQPECDMESVSKEVNKINALPLTATTEDTILKKCPLNNIKALATSTPHKNIVSDDITSRNSICTNTIASTDDVSVSSNLSNYSNNNSAELQNDDVPDVRIFVRRRRKVVKKAL